MNNEKVKEIKEYLQEEVFIATKFEDKLRRIPTRDLQTILTLINELESENKKLKRYKLDWLNSEKMHLQADMEDTEFELSSSNRLFEIVSKENQQLKDRIAELEQENETKTNTIIDLLKKQEFYETEKLKQFSEMLKEKGIVLIQVIDETLNEFVKGE